VVHSIELLLDEDAESTVRRQWRLLADAGLPSEHRTSQTGSSAHHRPHVTMLACQQIPLPTALGLGPLLSATLPLPIVLGAPMLFGPANVGRPGLILVRQVLASVELLQLQEQVREACPEPLGVNFGPGRWAPHVTLAKRLRPDQIPAALQILARSGASNGSPRELATRAVGCRFWQSDLKQARSLI
jgi:hypothetical protein